jgi:hypothetical protein
MRKSRTSNSGAVFPTMQVFFSAFRGENTLYATTIAKTRCTPLKKPPGAAFALLRGTL